MADQIPVDKEEAIDSDNEEPTLPDNYELELNKQIVQISSSLTMLDQLLGPKIEELDHFEIAKLTREESVTYWDNDNFEPLDTFHDLCRFKDKGVSIIHYIFSECFSLYLNV
jgi:hypothetical protein